MHTKNRTTHLHPNPHSSFILTLGNGENLFKALSECADRMKLPSAMVTGLGSIAEVKMGYYLHDKKQHITKHFSGIYEIASLVGNITLADNRYFIHLHAGISNEHFQVMGGHIIDAEAGPATELMIVPFDSPIYRKFNPDLGIFSICHEENT
jgi:uncharacterized protein